MPIKQQQHQLQQQCPTTVQFFGANDASDFVKSWFNIENNPGAANIVSEIIGSLFSGDIDVATGKEIIADGNQFDEVCQRLPLNDNVCYAATHSDDSFFNQLVANFVPFGGEIIKAKQHVDDLLDEIPESFDDLINFFKEEIFGTESTCAAINEDFIGVADFPGMLS